MTLQTSQSGAYLGLFSLMSSDYMVRTEEYVDEKITTYAKAKNGRPLEQNEIELLKQDVMSGAFKKMTELNIIKILDEAFQKETITVNDQPLKPEMKAGIKATLMKELEDTLIGSLMSRIEIVSKRTALLAAMSKKSIEYDGPEKMTYYFEEETGGIKHKAVHEVNLRTDANKVADGNANTWLHIACQSGSEVMIEGFLALGGKIDLEVRNKEGYTPLMVAAKANRQKAVELLLAAGANRNAVREAEKSEDKQCVLQIAVSESSPQMVDAILKNGKERLDLENNSSGNTPLYHALGLGKKEAAKLLIAAGANYNDIRFVNAAIRGKDIEHLKFLIDKGIKIVGVESYAVYIEWNVRKAKELPNANPLFWAAMFGDAEIVKTLVAAGDDPHRIYTDKTNVIFHAKRNADAMRVFLEEYHVNPNQVSDEGFTAIGCDPDKYCLKLLLENGANPNVGNKDGYTLLHFESSTFGDPESLELLLKHGVKPDITAYHTTVLEIFLGYDGGHDNVKNKERLREIVRLFLEKGAKVTAKVLESRPAENDPELRKLLSKHQECVLV